MQKYQINNNIINYFGVMEAVHAMIAHTWAGPSEGLLRNIIMPAPAVAVMFGIFVILFFVLVNIFACSPQIDNKWMEFIYGICR